MAKIDYLEEERQKLWKRITLLESSNESINLKLKQIEEDLQKNTSDFTNEAKQSSRMSSQYRNKSKDSLVSIEKILTDSKDQFDTLSHRLQLTFQSHSTIEELTNASKTLLLKIKSVEQEISENKQTIDSNVENIKTVFANISEYTTIANKVDTILENAESNRSKIEATLKKVIERKTEIDDIYYEIFGYTEENDLSGDKTVVEGLKEKLANSYTELTRLFESIKSDIENYQKETNATFNQWYKSTDNDVNNIKSDIRKLLPDALTAGLSHAFSHKRNIETSELARYQKSFTKSIWGMVLISLIPIGIAIRLIFKEVELEALFTEIMPRVLLSILPIYIPVLWIAISANKNAKLSKRLIEEYTHKEVISKTFEGLSNQIEKLEEEHISKELHTKLLFNILNVSIENPGKLISDYDKSDHPLMDALDKSLQLTNALDKLSNIPGLRKVVEAIEKRTKTNLQEKVIKAEKGLEVEI